MGKNMLSGLVVVSRPRGPSRLIEMSHGKDTVN